jgi:2-dehydropantoate 2-reductase
VKDSILIIGAGAMACLFAGELSKAGYPVTMLDRWQAGIDALNSRGLRVIDDTGQQKIYSVRAVTDPHAANGANLALVLVKSWQTEEAAGWLKTCLKTNGVAASLQNGLGNYETLVQFLGTKRTAAGITTLGATLLSPGQVQVHSQGEVVFSHHEHLAPLLNILSAAGMDVSTSQNITGLLWGKLLINAAINPLTALLDVPNGRLLELPETRDLMYRLAAETESVANALHIQLPFASSMPRIEEVLRLTASNSSSMRQDLLRGAQTEIDAINGAVSRYGEECGVATPYNRSVWQLVRARVAVKGPA